MFDAKMENASSVKNFKIVLWKYNSELEKSIFQKVCKVQYKVLAKAGTIRMAKKIYLF
jgi:hypothetical protein